MGLSVTGASSGTLLWACWISFVLMIPLSKQLARFLEFRMQDKASISDGMDVELRQLRTVVEGLEDKLRSVSDRQEFLEKILKSRETEPPRLPR